MRLAFEFGKRHELLIVLLSLATLPAFADAAAIRGKLIDHSGNAVGAVAVTAKSADGARRSAPSKTDGDGLYYINVPAGNYTLEVWAVPDGPPLKFRIVVHEPSTDIQPIQVH